MGLTPLEGLMMELAAVTSTVAPSAHHEERRSDSDEMSTLLNKKSGVLGMFEKSSDMRELEDAVARGEERAILTEKHVLLPHY